MPKFAKYRLCTRRNHVIGLLKSRPPPLPPGTINESRIRIRPSPIARKKEEEKEKEERKKKERQLHVAVIHGKIDLNCRRRKEGRRKEGKEERGRKEGKEGRRKEEGETITYGNYS